jgi:hypothetical protein
VSVVPAAFFLVDFGIKDLASGTVGAEVSTADPLAPDAGAPDATADAYARGLEEGRQSAQAEAAAHLEAHQAAAEQTLTEARAAWCREEGARIAELIGIAVGDMELRIADAVDRILRPFMDEAIRVRAIDELRTILQELVSANPDMALEISGPEDLLGQLRESLSGTTASVAYAASAACEVRVKAGASLIETRIAAWLQTYEGQPA